MERKNIVLRRNATVAGLGRIERVECASGLVWITGCGSAEDVILRAGEARNLSGSKGICIQALKDAEIGIVRASRKALLRRALKSRGQ